MDIETLLRKLRPLIPKQVGHWRRLHDLADADTRSLLERHIISVAHRLLGDFRTMPLLSLPAKGKARGSIKLGTVLYEKEKWPLGISEPELLQNLAIFGRSGAGKTNAAFLILGQLIDRKIPFLFLDWKRTGRHLLPMLKSRVHVYTPGRSLSPFPFNPFIVPPGVEARVHLHQVVDVLADAYTLGDGARSLIQKALSRAYERTTAPTADDLLGEIVKMPDRERVRGWKITAIRALESLTFAYLTGRDAESQHELAEQLLHQNTIVELDGLSANARKFLVPLLCLWLYSVRLADSKRETLQYVIFVEEAHHLIYGQPRKARESLMEMLFRQCRELGVAMIVIDQHPHLISTAALGNTYTTICLNLKDPKDLNKAADLSLVEAGARRLFSQLPVGQAVVKLQDRWTEPVLIRMPQVDIEKGSVTDDDVRHLMRDNLSGSGRKRLVKGICGRVRGIRVMDNDVLRDEALRFLEDVMRHRQDGVKKRYQRLGLSGDKGNRLKGELIEQGWLDGDLLATGTTRILLLRLTRKARTVFGRRGEPEPHESLAHAYWKHFYAQRLARDGWRVATEAKRVGGKVDLLGTRNGERIGIEIETGKSDVAANVRNGLRSRFERVIVVATDEQAMKRVETTLAKAHLLIPGRIDVVLCGQLGQIVAFHDDEDELNQAA